MSIGRPRATILIIGQYSQLAGHLVQQAPNRGGVSSRTSRIEGDGLEMEGKDKRVDLRQGTDKRFKITSQQSKLVNSCLSFNHNLATTKVRFYIRCTGPAHTSRCQTLYHLSIVTPGRSVKLGGKAQSFRARPCFGTHSLGSVLLLWPSQPMLCTTI